VHNEYYLAFEAVANGEDYDEDERDDDTEDDEFDLHVLVPHLAPHSRPLLPEISSLVMELLCPADKYVDLLSAINGLMIYSCHAKLVVSNFRYLNLVASIGLCTVPCQCFPS
jgi:hypothetical protein